MKKKYINMMQQVVDMTDDRHPHKLKMLLILMENKNVYCDIEKATTLAKLEEINAYMANSYEDFAKINKKYPVLSHFK